MKHSVDYYETQGYKVRGGGNKDAAIEALLKKYGGGK